MSASPFSQEQVDRVARSFAEFCRGLPDEDREVMEAFVSAAAPTDVSGFMKGDFGSLSFDPSRVFVAVLMQQGAVQLDSDWNDPG